jgi:hypothetical protein
MYKLKDNRIWDKHGIINRKQLYQILAKTEKILKFNLIQIIQRRINNLDLLKRFKSIRYNEGHSFLWGAATASYQVEGGITNNDWDFYTRSKAIKNRISTLTTSSIFYKNYYSCYLAACWRGC